MLELHFGRNYPTFKVAFSVQERKLASHSFGVGHGSVIRSFLFLACDHVLGHYEGDSESADGFEWGNQDGVMKVCRVVKRNQGKAVMTELQ
jgi:hypothetical protein